MVVLSSGKPKEPGVYACRVNSMIQGFHEDRFLLWYEDRWWYPGSSEGYRGEVYFWLGPIPRTRPTYEVKEAEATEDHV